MVEVQNCRFISVYNLKGTYIYFLCPQIVIHKVGQSLKYFT
jgi:hypothetical protein